MRSPSLEIGKALLMLLQHGQLLYLALECAGIDFEVIFRPLTLKEANIIDSSSQALPDFLIADWISESCVLCLIVNGEQESSPNYITTLAPAGLADRLSKCIIDISGFSSVSAYTGLLNECREEMQTMQAGIETFICAAFPGTKPSDIDKMTLFEQMKLLSRAELILGQALDISPTKPGAAKEGRASMSPEAAAILSEGAADKPDPKLDNARLDPFLSGAERIGVEPDDFIKTTRNILSAKNK